MAARVAVRAFARSYEPPDRFGEMHIFDGGAYIGVNPIDQEEINLSLVCDAATIKEAGGALPALLAHCRRSTDLSARFDTSDLRGVRSVTPVSSLNVFVQ